MPYGPEIRAGIDRLLGDIKEQASAGPLRLHDPDRGLRHALVAVEIEFEALAQNVFVDLADAALPGGAGVRHHDIDAAESGGDLIESRLHRSRIGHVAAHRQRRGADRRGAFGRRREIDIEQGDFGTRGSKGFRRCRADCAGRSGYGGDLTGERRLLAVRRALPAPAASTRNRTFPLRKSTRSGRWLRRRRRPSIHASAMSAAIAASRFERPRPNRPRPATITTRGSGSSSRLVPPTRVLWRSK